ncbi:MAG TPA: oligosaccharide flippase family protein [Vicinamibacterales bacterium]|nr:oligosaccharide flippase family protein [Vicinamibacterales bacterium]
MTGTRRFIANVIWSWAGVLVNVVLGLFLSAILVQKLGVARYGVWVLLFSTMDYLRLLDFGLRSAVINRVARHQATGDTAKVNETVSTAIVYFLLMSAACCAAAFAGRDAAMHVFNIDAALQADARTLMVIIALSISMRLIFSPVTAALEAYQRFDAINHAYIAALAARAGGSIALLLAGYGLVALGYLVLVVQTAEDLWNLASLKRVFPGFRMSPALVRREAFGGMISYGKHSSVMAAANLLSIQSPTTVLGYLRGPSDVAFFAFPWRLLMYTTEAVAKVGQITASVTAELDARHDAQNVWRMAIVTNRNCLALFMPAAIFLLFYAAPLLTAWAGPEVAAGSSALMPVLVVPFLFAIAAQFNSGAVLIGQARHGPYARAFVVEVTASIAALCVVVPRFGAFGAACVVAAALLLNRGVYLAVLMCRVNGLSIRRYLESIYLRPLAAAVPAAAAAAVLRFGLLPGRSWTELIAAAAIVALVYFAVAFFTVLDSPSRRQLLARMPGASRVIAV